ncbi:MAG: 16S rRNA (cytosine(1402)-N(4))-methyltransferase RsmH [Clostridiales bacterium]
MSEAAPFNHIPVLLDEVLNALQPLSDGIYIDGTLGGGGHSVALLAASAPAGFLLGIDRDDAALTAADARLAVYAGRYRLIRANYADMAFVAAKAGIESADGILLDIGVSSPQLDEESRGFSYHSQAPLDMRMDQRQELSAAILVNRADEAELTDIIYRYGEERWAKRIAQFIVAARREQPLETTLQLSQLIQKAIPAGAREKDQHPARRTFQALRIAVNGELTALEQGIDAAISLLKPGGRLAIITFHSLEDRIVKEKFRYHASNCICPKELPICVCHHQAMIRQVNKKPLIAGMAELNANPRARSAKLRVAEKI